MYYCKVTYKHLFVMLLAVVISLCLVNYGNRVEASEVAVIKVKYRWASEVAPIVRGMLSANGTLSVSKQSNSLVIVDNPAAIRRVRAYLDQFDRALEQFTIRVRFYENRESAQESAAERLTASGDNSAATPVGRKNDGAEFSVQERYNSQTNFTETFVVATDGQPAFIQAGRQIPYTGRWEQYTGGASVRFQSVETGFDVTPTAAGDLVKLRIVPRISYGPRKEAVIRFYGAGTEIAVTYGKWVEIGGTGSHSNEIIREILSQGRQSRRSTMTMSVMVEKQ